MPEFTLTPVNSLPMRIRTVGGFYKKIIEKFLEGTDDIVEVFAKGKDELRVKSGLYAAIYKHFEGEVRTLTINHKVYLQKLNNNL